LCGTPTVRPPSIILIHRAPIPGTVGALRRGTNPAAVPVTKSAAAVKGPRRCFHAKAAPPEGPPEADVVDKDGDLLRNPPPPGGWAGDWAEGWNTLTGFKFQTQITSLKNTGLWRIPALLRTEKNIISVGEKFTRTPPGKGIPGRSVDRAPRISTANT